jgi:hypothetical protein
MSGGQIEQASSQTLAKFRPTLAAIRSGTILINPHPSAGPSVAQVKRSSLILTVYHIRLNLHTAEDLVGG